MNWISSDIIPSDESIENDMLLLDIAGTYLIGWYEKNPDQSGNKNDRFVVENRYYITDIDRRKKKQLVVDREYYDEGEGFYSSVFDGFTQETNEKQQPDRYCIIK